MKKSCFSFFFFKLEKVLVFVVYKSVFQCDKNLVLCPLRGDQCLIKQTTSLSFLLF